MGLSTNNLNLIRKLAPDVLTRPLEGSDGMHHITPAELERLMVAARREGYYNGERSAPRGEGG